jgi:hypothetical protein
MTELQRVAQLFVQSVGLVQDQNLGRFRDFEFIEYRRTEFQLVVEFRVGGVCCEQQEIGVAHFGKVE